MSDHIKRSDLNPKNVHNYLLAIVDLLTHFPLYFTPKLQNSMMWFSNYVLFNLEAIAINRAAKPVLNALGSFFKNTPYGTLSSMVLGVLPNMVRQSLPSMFLGAFIQG